MRPSAEVSSTLGTTQTAKGGRRLRSNVLAVVATRKLLPPPALPDAFRPLRSARVLTAPNGGTLTARWTTEDGSWCDKCGVHVTADSLLFGCEVEDYDLCEGCYASPRRIATPLRRPVPLSLLTPRSTGNGGADGGQGRGRGRGQTRASTPPRRLAPALEVMAAAARRKTSTAVPAAQVAGAAPAMPGFGAAAPAPEVMAAAGLPNPKAPAGAAAVVFAEAQRAQTVTHKTKCCSLRISLAAVVQLIFLALVVLFALHHTNDCTPGEAGTSEVLEPGEFGG